MRFTVEELARAVRGRIYGIDPKAWWNGVSTDSRTIKPGQVFFCLKGERFDGHDFIPEAGMKGMVVAVARHQIDRWPVVVVEDPLWALGELAAYHRARFRIPLIAVSGTSGKTTTKNLIAQVLRVRYRVHSTRGNLNNLIGLPLTLLGLRPSHQIAVVELGASRRGEIARLCEICRPQVGVLTNIGPAHLEFFGGLEGAVQAECELLRALPGDGYAVLNLDDDRVLQIRPFAPVRVMGYGLSNGDGLRAEKVELTPEGSRFKVKGRWYWVPLLGRHNVYNSLAALQCGRIFKVPAEGQRWALARARPEPMRARVFKQGGITLLDDSYNANPDSVRAGLELLRLFSGRRVVVLADMRELGSESLRYHREIGEEARRVADLLVFIGEEARGYGPGHHFRTWVEAEGFLRSQLRSGDVVLLKGSRALRLDQLVKRLRG